MSVAVQTLPPPETETVDSTCRSSPIAPTKTKSIQRGGLTNVTVEIQALVGKLSDAIDGFQAESRSMQGTLKSRRRPTDTSFDPPPANPSPTLDDVGVPLIPHSPPKHKLPAEPPFPQPSPNKTRPDFQQILRIEHECIR